MRFYLLNNINLSLLPLSSIWAPVEQQVSEGPEQDKRLVMRTVKLLQSYYLGKPTDTANITEKSKEFIWVFVTASVILSSVKKRTQTSQTSKSDANKRASCQTPPPQDPLEARDSAARIPAMFMGMAHRAVPVESSSSSASVKSSSAIS